MDSLLDHLAHWVGRSAVVWEFVVVGVVGLLLLIYRGVRPAATAGAAAILFGLFIAWLLETERVEPVVARLLFALFGGLSVIAALLMIAQRNPVYAALYFALVVLASSGLFLLLSAPFIAAAAIIVYAGAIIVMFLFVIMLAQQSGLAPYDQRFWQPLPSAVAGGLLLGTILTVLNGAYRETSSAEAVLRRLDEIQFQLAAPNSSVDGVRFPTLMGYGYDDLLADDVRRIADAETAGDAKKTLADAAAHWRGAWKVKRSAEPVTTNVVADSYFPPAMEAESGERDAAAVHRAAGEMADAARKIIEGRAAHPTVLNPKTTERAHIDAKRSRLATPSLHDASAATVLGRALWGDYLLGVELAGTLLLVATVGAIAINQRQKEFTA